MPMQHDPAPPTRGRRVRALGRASVAGSLVVLAAACGDFQLVEFTKATTTTVEVESAEGADAVPEESTSTTLRPARHTVEPGESLGSIATRFGVTVDSIMLANNITNPNSIEAGTRIVIPNPDALVPPPWQQGDSLAVNR